jgi:transcriptional regulator of nitric oxide reductase
MSLSVRCLALSIMTALGILASPPASAADDLYAQPISQYLLASVFPGADDAGPFEGTPPAAGVRKDGVDVGYLLSTLSVVGSMGYSGKPLDVLVGIDRRAVVTGAVLIQQTEPILVIGITEEQLTRYVGGFAGLDLRPRLEAGDERTTPDAISGATVSSAVIRDSIVRAGRAVARSRGLLGEQPGGERLDRETMEIVDWQTLVDDGSVATKRFTEGGADGNTLLLDLYAALLTPPRIGESLLGKLTYTRLVAGLGPDDQLILVAANGLKSIKGTAFKRSGRFERMQVVQGDRTIPLTTDGYSNIETLDAAGTPQFREIGVFTVRGSSGFDPLRPWRLDVRAPTASDQPAALPSLTYDLSDRYRKPSSASEPQAMAEEAATADQPLWQRSWLDRTGRIAPGRC